MDGVTAGRTRPLAVAVAGRMVVRRELAMLCIVVGGFVVELRRLRTVGRWRDEALWFVGRGEDGTGEGKKQAGWTGKARHYDVVGNRYLIVIEESRRQHSTLALDFGKSKRVNGLKRLIIEMVLYSCIPVLIVLFGE